MMWREVRCISESCAGPANSRGNPRVLFEYNPSSTSAHQVRMRCPRCKCWNEIRIGK